MRVKVTGNGIGVTERERSLVSGSAVVYECHLDMDDEASAQWAGFSRTLVFRNGSSKVEIEVTPGADGTAVVPWEVLEEPGELMVGCYGTSTSGARRVTPFADVGCVERGCYGGATAGTSPTPTPYQQLSAMIAELREELAGKQDATGVYLQMGKDSDGNTTPQVVVGQEA